MKKSILLFIICSSCFQQHEEQIQLTQTSEGVARIQPASKIPELHDLPQYTYEDVENTVNPIKEAIRETDKKYPGVMWDSPKKVILGPAKGDVWKATSTVVTVTVTFKTKKSKNKEK